MGIKDFFRRRRIEKIAGDTLDNANDAESLQKATDVIIRALKKHPEMKGELLSKIGMQIDGDNEIPNTLMDEVAKGITNTEGIPNQIISRKGVIDALTDDGITTIIQEGNIDQNLQNNLADSITDINKRQKVKKEITKNILSELYNECGNLKDADLITKIKELQLNQSNMHTKNRITNIIARQMAYNYIKFNGIIFSRFDEILSVEEMFSLNFPVIIEKIIIEDLNEEKLKKIPKDFNEGEGFVKKWRKKLLEDVADKIARRYTDTGIWNVPNSEEMRKISEEEEQFLLNTIENKLENLTGLKLTSKSLLDIRSQIRGKSNVNSIIDTMTKLGLFDLLLNMPTEEANKLIKVFTIFTRNKSHREKKDGQQSEELR